MLYVHDRSVFVKRRLIAVCQHVCRRPVGIADWSLSVIFLGFICYKAVSDFAEEGFKRRCVLCMEILAAVAAFFRIVRVGSFDKVRVPFYPEDPAYRIL